MNLITTEDRRVDWLAALNRMIRDTLLAVSILLTVTTLTFWVASYMGALTWRLSEYRTADRGVDLEYYLGISQGKFYTYLVSPSYRWPQHASYFWRGCPMALPFAIFAAWPTLAFVQGPLRRHRRHAQGCCIRCGYSLKGLPAPRCPECGYEAEAR